MCADSVSRLSRISPSLRALDDRDSGRQHRDVLDVDVLQLLAGGKPHDLRVGRIQPQSAGSPPLIDIMDANSEAVDSYPYIADWHADINLAVIGILVDVDTMMQDQLFKLTSVQKFSSGTSTEPCETVTACWIADR